MKLPFEMSVQKIKYLDKETKEAYVSFTLSDNSLIEAFCHPCNFVENEKTEAYFEYIESELPESTFWDWNKNKEKKIIPLNPEDHTYAFYGQIKSIHPVVIDCGSASITNGDWINDEKVVGSYVYVCANRLDVQKY